MNTERNFQRPYVVVSKCLGFEKCRYNGITIYDDFVEKLKPYVEYITVCPEVEIGLGVPRDPIRVVSEQGDLRLRQPASKKDITDMMKTFCTTFLTSIKVVDGFLLKSRSPSCGIKEVKIYPSMEKSAALGKGMGFFGHAVWEHFPQFPIEDEGRIKNFRIREHFLTKLFIIAKFRQMNTSQSMKALVKFHTESKFLLMACSQKHLKILGQIVANHEKRRPNEVFELYKNHLFNAFSLPPRYTSNINVLMHSMGYFSEKLSSTEKRFFLESLEKYRTGKIPLSVNLGILKSWIIRFEEDYLAQQNFFEPYPEGLVEITDSGKGRKLS